MGIDWNSNDESIVVRPVQAIAVYINAKGDIAIVQQGYYGDDDFSVCFPADQAEKIIAAIQHCVKECNELVED